MLAHFWWDRETHERVARFSPPPLLARVLAVIAIVVAGLCGGLIGWAVADLQCSGTCTAAQGAGGLVGAAVAAGGVGIIAVLALQALAEWRAQEGRRRSDHD